MILKVLAVIAALFGLKVLTDSNVTPATMPPATGGQVRKPQPQNFSNAPAEVTLPNSPIIDATTPIPEAALVTLSADYQNLPVVPALNEPVLGTHTPVITITGNLSAVGVVQPPAMAARVLTPVNDLPAPVVQPPPVANQNMFVPLGFSGLNLT